MSYLPSGTNYVAPLSTVLPGILNNGNDFTATFYNNAASLTVSGISANVVTSRVNHNYSGAAIYVIGLPATELQNPTLGYATSSTPSEFTVFDTFGGAGGANIKVSGAALATGAVSTITINGSTAPYTAITAAYGSKKFINVSGAAWIAV